MNSPSRVTTALHCRVTRIVNRPFIDSDHELEARCGVKVPVIFEIEGEAGFRDREEAMCTSRPARDGQAAAAWQDASETLKALAVALSKSMSDERQCQAEHERVMTFLVVRHSEMMV